MENLFAIITTPAILAALAVPTFAQGRSCRSDSRYQPYQTRRNVRTYYDNSRTYDNRVYYDYGYRDRSLWDRHRNKLTLAIPKTPIAISVVVIDSIVVGP